MKKFFVSAFSDEYAENFEVQCQALTSFGIEYMEMRGVNGKNVSVLTNCEIKEAKNILVDYGIKVSSIGSPLGKIKLDGDICGHLETARRVFETANELGAKNIRCFSFYLPDGKTREECKGQVFDELAKVYRKRFPKPLTEAEVEAIKNGDTLPPSIPARIYRACASFLSTSLAAQTFTAPLLLLYFGYISGWALLLNCFFVPFIGAVFSLLLLSVGAACVLPMFAKAFLYIPNLIWSAVLLLFELVDFTKFAIEGISISATMIAIYLTSTLFFTDKWNLKKSARWMLGGVCIFAFGVGMVALNV